MRNRIITKHKETRGGRRRKAGPAYACAPRAERRQARACLRLRPAAVGKPSLPTLTAGGRRHAGPAFAYAAGAGRRPARPAYAYARRA